MAAAAGPIPDADRLEQETNALAQQARAITITDATTYADAGGFLKSIKAMRDRVAETFGPIQSKAHAAWQEVIRQRKQIEAPMEEAERILKRSISAYVEQEDRKAREEAARAAAEARRQDEERRLAEAAALEAAGESEAAEAVLDEPPSAPPVAPPPVAKVSGISTRVTYKARVTDIRKLARAVADGTPGCPSSLLVANESALNAMARASGKELQIPGVEVYEERSVAASGRR